MDDRPLMAARDFLMQIFRQAAGSTIITNAHRINKGEMPLFPPDKTPGSSDRVR